MSANQIAKGSVVSDMLAALVVAREFVSTDRNSLADASIGTDGSRDTDDQAALDDYDQALVQIDAAIARATECQGPSSPDNTGGPAFPVEFDHQTFAPRNVKEAKRLMSGMTLRDYFAAKAMQAWLVGVENPKIEGCAKSAYEIADAMLAARQGGAA